MSDRRWVRVTSCDNVPPREGRAVTIAGREIAIFNLGDRFFATDNRCPHRGGPLCDGIVTGAAVVCPLHAWKVNLENGEVERPAGGNGCVGTYPTRMDDGVVVIGLPVDHAGSTEQDPAHVPHPNAGAALGTPRRAGPVDPPTENKGQAA